MVPHRRAHPCAHSSRYSKRNYTGERLPAEKPSTCTYLHDCTLLKMMDDCCHENVGRGGLWDAAEMDDRPL